MKRHFFGMSGAVAAAALLVTACASDPTEDLRGTGVRIVTSLSFMELRVGDSLQVTAQTRDAQGNALASLPTVASSDASVVTVQVDEELSGNPVPETVFFVKAVGFGQTTVTASEASVTDGASITVVTFPASVEVTSASGANTLGSGESVDITGTPLSSDNQPVTGPSIAWATDDATIASISDSVGATITVTGGTPGRAIISAESDGGAEGQITIDVVPGMFTGTASATAGGFGTMVTVTSPLDLSGASVTLGALATPALLSAQSAGSITFAIPSYGVSEDVDVVIADMGAAGLAQAFSFAYNTSVVPVNDDVATPNDDPLTAPPVPGSLFLIVLEDGVDTQDFFTLDNSAGTTSLDLDVTVSWNSGQDVDLLMCNEACDAFTSTSGATGANPEHASVSIPAGEIWRLWLDLYDAHGSTIDIIQVQIDGL